MSTTALPRPFGRFTLVQRLATGGMAEVYLAKAAGEAGFEKMVAIKRVHPVYAAAGRKASSLIDEAKLSVALSHPNIVQTFDLGRTEGADFIVMEHVEGYDVQHVLDALARRDALFPVDLAAYVISKVCRGLDFAHDFRDARGDLAGVVHRDISPQNILLSFAGEVKIADFGIATTRDRRSDPGARVIKGKYFYMSPEQASARPMDRRSDIFSTGVVLWELLVGRRLYQASDVRSLLAEVRRARVPAPSSMRAEVPAELDAIIARATAASPDHRFATAGDMAIALDAYLATRPPVRASRDLGSLLVDLPAPTVVSKPPPAPMLPQTRDRVATMPAEVRPTPAEPPLRYDLEDGRPTLAGRRSPAPATHRHEWGWLLVFGIALVGVVTWVFYGR